MPTTKSRVSIVSEYLVPDWSARPIYLSAECAPKGSAQCDGHDYDTDTACDCPCHLSDLPDTVEAVKVWHDDLHAGRLDPNSLG